MRALKKLLIVTLALAIFLPSAFCQSEKYQALAREHRKRGLGAQSIGDVDSAIKYFQRAIETDPFYVVAYNDLGIAYEAKGLTDRAEDIYLKGLRLDPKYLYFYSNLGSLYEKKNDFKQAAFYWKQRRDLGEANDAWTQKAGEKSEELSEKVPELKKQLQEERAAELSIKLAQEKKEKELQMLQEAKEHLDKGVSYFRKNDFNMAKQEFEKVLRINPQDEKAADYLTKINKSSVEKQIKEYSELGLKYYQKGDTSSAIIEFDKILTLISEQPVMESK